MNKILIYIDSRKYGEYDIFSEINYDKIDQFVDSELNGNFYNVGNRLWFQAIISEIDDGNNEIELYTKDMSFDYINQTYDMIIAPMANIFSIGYTKLLDKLADFFECIEIKTFVIACGVQVAEEKDLEEVVNKTKQSAKRFINSIYKNGGEFALRGYFSKKYFDLICPNTAVVTGCPSLFQYGPNIHINNEINTKKIAINGQLNISKIVKGYDFEFFDQHVFYHALYGDELAEKNLFQLVKKYSFLGLKYLINEKINLFIDMKMWQKYLVDNDFSLSIGSRIHGSIMPILLGIPALVCTPDMRTKEICEYFNIPNISINEVECMDINKLIEIIDYEEFNNSFGEKYKIFENFLIDNKIVKKMGIRDIEYEKVKKIVSKNKIVSPKLKRKFKLYTIPLYIFNKL